MTLRQSHVRLMRPVGNEKDITHRVLCNVEFGLLTQIEQRDTLIVLVVRVPIRPRVVAGSLIFLTREFARTSKICDEATVAQSRSRIASGRMNRAIPVRINKPISAMPRTIILAALFQD